MESRPAGKSYRLLTLCEKLGKAGCIPEHAWQHNACLRRSLMRLAKKPVGASGDGRWRECEGHPFKPRPSISDPGGLNAEGDVVRPKILLDEALHGMAEFLRDDGWETIRLVKAAKDDAVLDRARLEGHIVVTGDEKLLDRCRRKGVEVIDVGFKGQLVIVEAYLKKKLRATP